MRNSNDTMTIEYENTLRRIISLIIGTEDSAKFNISPERISIWKEKREAENKKYKGSNIESRLIYYSDFYDLKIIVHKNWEIIKDILIDKKRFESNFDQIEAFRNTISHGREIFPFQENLIIGITGDLKSLLVKYHNKNMDANDYFIRILKISDNLGNQWEIGKGNLSGLITKSTIQVNDTVNIKVEAYDPKNREITYNFSCQHFNIENKNGNLELIVTKEMIKKIFSFSVRVYTENQDYENTESKTFHYSVIP